jgi:hypothetical protein
MALTCLHDQKSAPIRTYLAANCVVEVPMLNALDDKTLD